MGVRGGGNSISLLLLSSSDEAVAATAERRRTSSDLKNLPSVVVGLVCRRAGGAKPWLKLVLKSKSVEQVAVNFIVELVWVCKL